jgi:O-antigen ligase
MIRALRQPAITRRIRTWLIAAAVLVLAFLLGQRASRMWLGLLVAGIGGLALLARPVLGLPVLVLAALAVQMEVSTGTEVNLNAASLFIPALLGIGLLDLLLRQGRIRIAPSRVNMPLALFLAASLLSLLIGRATWDPAVPVRGSFLLVQLAQWAIFAFSAGAFWLTGNLIKDERWLWRLTVVFLLVGGGLAILRFLPGTSEIARRSTTYVFRIAPFWILLTAMAAGQLLYNRALSLPWRAFLVAVLGACVYFALVEERMTASNWVGMAAVLGTLLWLRFPRLRWPVTILLVLLTLSGVLMPIIYQFAGGNAEWDESGGSRLALIGRVIEVTMRNPITGLGPAAYRPYAGIKPLPYMGAYWVAPQVNSHNNYVDLFAHGGILGLLLFFWFAWEVARLGLSLRKRCTNNFAAGYVDSMLAAGAGALVIMALADWILPFVYNVGFIGFQASVLVWLFLGGMVALEQMAPDKTGELQTNDT